ncbi:MAG: DUF4760 domain-containing protein [Ilumatobacteraceae bacterium]
MWKAKPISEKARITAVMNFYEMVATEYNSSDLLDKQVADRSLIPVADEMWCQAESFISWLRLSNPRSYDEWEQMHRGFTRPLGSST